MVTLGVDVGTTSVKAIAVRDDGAVLGRAQREYPLLAPGPGRYELDTAVVARASRGAIAAAAAQAAAAGAGRVVALASSALGEAVAPVDAEGRGLANTVVALDHRATAEAAALRQQVPPAEYFRITGQEPHPIATICKLLWWRANEPALFASAARFLCWNEMLGCVLGLPPAETAGSPSLAARTGLFDIERRAWSPRLLALAGVEESRLARVLPAGAGIAPLPRRVCDELGLAPGCVYASGGWDQVCAALGSGAVDDGTVVNSMGSTDSLNAVYAGTRTGPAMSAAHLTCNPHALDGLSCTNAFSITGGNLLDWYHGLLDPGAGEAGWQEALVAEAMTAERPVLVLPHFSGSGTPHMDPESLGAFVGLTLGTSRADIARGILEGVALEMALNLEALRAAGIPVARVVAGSGGARDPRLLQMRADAFGMPVAPLSVADAGCMAAALLARAAVARGVALREAAAAAAPAGTPVEPSARGTARFRDLRELYAGLYGALAPASHRLAALHAREG